MCSEVHFVHEGGEVGRKLPAKGRRAKACKVVGSKASGFRVSGFRTFRG